jgi:hypothetical protein
MQQDTARMSRLALRVVFALPVLVSLVAGIAGGLLRAGVSMPEPVSGRWLGPAVAAHAFLMICAFMGTVVGIERAVAVKHPLAFVGPFASGVAGLAMLLGGALEARWLVVAASMAFMGVNGVMVLRQRAAHTVLLWVAAIARAIGSLMYAVDSPPGAVVPWWFSFLVLTIAAERLEMTRLMRRREGASQALYAIFCGMLLGAGWSAVSAPRGGALYGLSLSCLALWLLYFDIARRTVRTHGLSRYMAVCLLLGYVWLFIAGAAWLATALGLPFRDTALHGLALGFVFSMMLGHAPVILPAIARVKILFGWGYYVPLALLHGSLVVRLAWGHFDVAALACGAAGNALTVFLFAATLAGSALAWRIKYASPRTKQHHEVTVEH